MRKSLALALVLVFVITGAAFAATPSFSGNISVTAESESFTGPFTITPSFRTDMDIAEKGETWQADVRVRATWDPTDTDSVNIAINRYRGIFNGEGFTATIARNYSLGNIDTPFEAIRQAGNPSGVDQIRVSADLGGIAIATQLVGGNELKVRAQTSVDNFTIGAGAELKLDLEKSNYAGYVTTSFGDLISSAQVLFGSFNDTFKTAVGATIKPTEQLSVDVRYATEDVGNATKGYYVGGTFTEGLLQAKASIAEKDTEISASFVYRGSENNVAFGDLFSDDYWADNVAPAFGVFYTSTESAADPKIELKGVFATADNFVARASITLEGSKNDISAEAKLGLTEKVTLRPYFSNDKNDQSTYGLDVEYAISDNSSITVTAERSDEGGDLLKVVYSIDF
ncbi:MAG: hypothetical protein FWJ73_06410 [Limnochordales bacterium]